MAAGDSQFPLLLHLAVPLHDGVSDVRRQVFPLWTRQLLSGLRQQVSYSDLVFTKHCFLDPA